MQCIIHTRRRRNKKLQSTTTERERERKKEKKAKIFEGNAIVHAFNTRGERRMYIQREKKRGQQVDGVSGLSWLTPREWYLYNTAVARRPYLSRNVSWMYNNGTGGCLCERKRLTRGWHFAEFLRLFGEFYGDLSGLTRDSIVFWIYLCCFARFKYDFGFINSLFNWFWK